MALRADDGTLLEPKEAVVLDQDGNLLLDPADHESFARSSSSFQGFSKTRVFQVQGVWIPLLAVGLVVLFTLGSLVVGGALALGLSSLFILWTLKTLIRWVNHFLERR
ncbi:MAG: hypothetical protein ACO3A2_07025 [Bdellovibrionia bacterium]